MGIQGRGNRVGHVLGKVNRQVFDSSIDPVIDLGKRKDCVRSISEQISSLGVIAGLANRVLVMYGGQIVEQTPITELYQKPQHPYTLGLLASLPRLDELSHRRLASIDGMPPVLMEKPGSCPFAPRCQYVLEHCWHENPPLRLLGADHFGACWVDPETGKERA
jgi:oligopeptide transport system ATP-binding protein